MRIFRLSGNGHFLSFWLLGSSLREKKTPPCFLLVDIKDSVFREERSIKRSSVGKKSDTTKGSLGLGRGRTGQGLGFQARACKWEVI